MLYESELHFIDQVFSKPEAVALFLLIVAEQLGVFDPVLFPV